MNQRRKAGWTAYSNSVRTVEQSTSMTRAPHRSSSPNNFTKHITSLPHLRATLLQLMYPLGQGHRGAHRTRDLHLDPGLRVTLTSRDYAY